MSADFNETRVPTTDWQAYRGVLSRRIFAFLIDYAIIALLWIPAAVVVFFLGILTFGLGFFLYPALFAIVAMLYFGLTMGGPSQASAGMNVMGLALARVDGRPRGRCEPHPLRAHEPARPVEARAQLLARDAFGHEPRGGGAQGLGVDGDDAAAADVEVVIGCHGHHPTGANGVSGAIDAARRCCTARSSSDAAISCTNRSRSERSEAMPAR